MSFVYLSYERILQSMTSKLKITNTVEIQFFNVMTLNTLLYDEKNRLEDIVRWCNVLYSFEIVSVISEKYPNVCYSYLMSSDFKQIQCCHNSGSVS